MNADFERFLSSPEQDRMATLEEIGRKQNIEPFTKFPGGLVKAGTKSDAK